MHKLQYAQEVIFRVYYIHSRVYLSSRSLLLFNPPSWRGALTRLLLLARRTEHWHCVMPASILTRCNGVLFCIRFGVVVVVFGACVFYCICLLFNINARRSTTSNEAVNIIINVNIQIKPSRGSAIGCPHPPHSPQRRHVRKADASPRIYAERYRDEYMHCGANMLIRKRDDI